MSEYLNFVTSSSTNANKYTAGTFSMHEYSNKLPNYPAS